MDLEAYRKKLEKRVKQNEDAFNGLYKVELNNLLGLSRDEIDKLSPDTTDLKIYDQLIAIVKEASIHNIEQAELVNNIKSLGNIGISIAKKIPSLKTLM